MKFQRNVSQISLMRFKGETWAHRDHTPSCQPRKNPWKRVNVEMQLRKDLNMKAIHKPLEWGPCLITLQTLQLKLAPEYMSLKFPWQKRDLLPLSSSDKMTTEMEWEFLTTMTQPPANTHLQTLTISVKTPLRYRSIQNFKRQSITETLAQATTTLL